MRTIAEINAELAAAEQLVKNLRGERDAAILAACPYAVGQEFSTSGNHYKVVKRTPASSRSEVWLQCLFKTSSGKWSVGTRIVNHKIEG